MSERELIGQIQRGDQQAFVEFLQRYEARVYSLVYRTLPCRNDVDDVAQDALIEAWRGLSRFRFDSSLSTWLYRLTLNVAREHIRKCMARPTEPLDELEESGEFMPADDTDLEREVERIELHGMIERALDRLSAEHREVVVLHELHDLTYAEIAEVVGVPVGTVKSRLFHAFRKLRILLGPYVSDEVSNAPADRSATKTG